MNSFHAFITAFVLLNSIFGYTNGFFKTMLFLFKIMAAFIAAYFLYPHLGDLLVIIFPSIDELLLPASFLLCFVILYFITHIILIPVSRSAGKFRFKRVNSIAGILPGICCSVIGIAVLLRCMQFVSLPGDLEKEVKESEITAFIDPPAAWVENKLQPIFEKPFAATVASATGTIVHEDEMVQLSFVTHAYTTRTDLESQMLQLINEERTKNGLRPLVADTTLAKLARAHSADMFERGYFSHNTPEGIDPFQRIHLAHIEYSMAGENLALAPTLLIAHKGLMNSPGHRANILHTLYGKVGIGILDAGKYGLMITQEFRD